MSMRRGLKQLIGFIVVVIMVSCASRPQFALDEGAKSRLSEIRASLELKFAQNRKVWRFSIENGEMTLRDIMSIPPAYLKGKQFMRFRDEIPEVLPDIKGYDYYGPYGLSPDGLIMILSISPKNYWPAATDFILIRQDTKEVLFQRRYNNPSYQIEDISWSPNSELLALLEVSSERRHGIIDKISAMLGHVNEEGTFYLSIYNRKGDLIVTSKVASGLVNPGGQIFWKKEK